MFHPGLASAKRATSWPGAHMAICRPSLRARGGALALLAVCVSFTAATDCNCACSANVVTSPAQCLLADASCGDSDATHLPFGGLSETSGWDGSVCANIMKQGPKPYFALDETLDLSSMQDVPPT